METYKISVHLDTYIANPYWPEREKLINIQKESGMSRARTQQTRRKALDEYLESAGMTRAQYDELQRLAERPFYMHDDKIIVPELHVTSMLVATCDMISASKRPCDPELVRTLIKPSPWYTNKTRPDGEWDRFAVVSSGTGQKLSNQRALRTSQYIEDAEATGTISIHSMIRPEVVWKALDWAGTFVGIGSCRKMGKGRFTVEVL